jgi:Protein of unknown function DUF104
VSEGTTMTKVTEAVYSQGVLKPVEDLGLREDLAELPHDAADSG